MPSTAAALKDRPIESAVRETCVMGCKHPPGLILRIWDMGSGTVPVPGGGTREEPKAVPRDNGRAPTKIMGPATPVGVAPRTKIVNGYALNENVPRDIARQFMEQNKYSDFVTNGIVFVEDSMEDAIAHARDNKGIRSGLEQLDPRTTTVNGKQVPADARWPRPAKPEVSDLQTENPNDG